MNVTWLLEPEVFKGDLDPFIAKLQEMGVDHLICKFGTPYEKYLHTASPDRTVFLGSLQFAKLFRSSFSWKGVFCNLPKFDCTYYYPRFGEHLLNSQYIMLPFGDLERRKRWLIRQVGWSGKLFVRPASGGKSFTGKVIDEDEPVDIKLDPDTLIVVATPYSITKEWRLVIVNGEIVGGSQYKDFKLTGRWPGVPQNVLDYAKDVLKTVKYNPDPAWVLDICEGANNLRVLEVGSFSCSGLYACQPEPVIKAINAVISQQNA